MQVNDEGILRMTSLIPKYGIWSETPQLIDFRMADRIFRMISGLAEFYT